MFNMADTLLSYTQINTKHCRPACKTYAYEVPHFICMKRQTSQCSLYSYLLFMVRWCSITYHLYADKIFFLLPITSLHEEWFFSVLKGQCIVRSMSDLCYTVTVKAHTHVKEICISSHILFCRWLQAWVMWYRLIIMWENRTSLWILSFIYWIQSLHET